MFPLKQWLTGFTAEFVFFLSSYFRGSHMTFIAQVALKVPFKGSSLTMPLKANIASDGDIDFPSVAQDNLVAFS